VVDQVSEGTPQKVAVRIETDPAEDREASLEIGGGARVPVLFTVQPVDGIPTGYLRLAHGYGNFANRLIGSAGMCARLILPNQGERRVRIISTDPGEAPGYLCAFSFAE
jgi:hypothetical protein